MHVCIYYDVLLASMHTKYKQVVNDNYHTHIFLKTHESVIITIP